MTGLATVYCVAGIITWICLYQAVGFPSGGGWLEFVIPNLWWFGLFYLKLVGWPLTAAHWLYFGRRPSRWTAVTNLHGREVRAIMRTQATGSPVRND